MLKLRKTGPTDFETECLASKRSDKSGILTIMKILVSITLCICIASALPAQESIRREQVVMGTFAHLRIPASHADDAVKIFGAMRSAESSLSSYRSDGGAARLNRERRIEADRTLLRALSCCRTLFEMSGGYFDCTIGSLTRALYRFGEDSAVVPSKKVRQFARVGMDGVGVQGGVVELEEGIVLDLGGLGKGMGVDMAAEEAKRLGIESAVIGLSGDIRCLGPCEVAVENPFGGGAVGVVVNREGELGISTSGIYRRYIGTVRDNHLIDPYRKESADSLVSVTLVAKVSNALLDGLTTAAAVMPIDSAVELLRGKKIDALLIAKEGTFLRLGDRIKVDPKSLGGAILHPSLSPQQVSRYLKRSQVSGSPK